MRRCGIALVLGIAATAAGAATPIYRCGQTYSQVPCAGGYIIESSDPRSAAQRAEARQAAQREKELAERMERERRGTVPATASGFDARAAAYEAPASAAKAAKSAKGSGKAVHRASSAASAPGVLFITPRPQAK